MGLGGDSEVSHPRLPHGACPSVAPRSPTVHAEGASPSSGVYLTLLLCEPLLFLSPGDHRSSRLFKGEADVLAWSGESPGQDASLRISDGCTWRAGKVAGLQSLRLFPNEPGKPENWRRSKGLGMGAGG